MYIDLEISLERTVDEVPKLIKIRIQTCVHPVVQF